MVSILYIGSAAGTSGLRSAALARLGHSVDHVDPYSILKSHPLLGRYAYKTGGFGLEGLIERWIFSRLKKAEYDVLFVDNGELVGRQLAAKLSKLAKASVLYNLDNPFTNRDGLRWRAMLGSLPVYDLFVTPRYSSLAPATSAGARRPVRVVQAADEVAHRPIQLSKSDAEQFGSEVSFVGTWMPERGPFLAKLAAAGVPIAIFGPRWEKAPEYGYLGQFRRSGALNTEEYAKAIAGAKICLALLSKGNLDLHTTRSLEIPAMGQVLCGERTDEHLELYKEGEEALFWDSPEECAANTLSALQSDDLIQRMGRAGRARLLKNGNYNEPTLSNVLALL